MKNKGFTLVELLAVIAILAILVIVAMPNVLGMFNQAKVNSFVTEVQKIMDTATTAFTKDALTNSGKTVYYSSESNATLKTKPLDMSGNKKEYFIEMDRNGEFKRVLVYDDNYCYDAYTNEGSEHKFIMGSSNPTKIMNNYVDKKLDKTAIVSKDVWEAGNDQINVTMEGERYKIKGCESIVTVEGKQLELDKVKIVSTEYSYVPGMTWKDWTESDYNTDGYFAHRSNYIFSADSANSLRLDSYVISLPNYDCAQSLVEVRSDDQIIKNEEYKTRYKFDIFTCTIFFIPPIGEKYYEVTSWDEYMKYNQELKINSDPEFGMTADD